MKHPIQMTTIEMTSWYVICAQCFEWQSHETLEGATQLKLPIDFPSSIRSLTLKPTLLSAAFVQLTEDPAATFALGGVGHIFALILDHTCVQLCWLLLVSWTKLL